jgi:predicted DNA-binding protein (MmcQ/YjbR family)
VEIHELVAYCLAKPGAEETYPWGDHVLVAKVGGKGFAYIGMASAQVGVRAGELAAEWCERYADVVTPMSYLARHGWVTLALGRDLPDDEVRELVDSSYSGVVNRLPKTSRPAGA